MHIDLSGLHRFVSEPECDDGLIDPMVPQFHRCTVPKYVRTYSFAGQRRARLRGGEGMLVDEGFQSVAAEFRTTHTREERIVIQTCALLEPDIKHLDDLLA